LNVNLAMDDDDYPLETMENNVDFLVRVSYDRSTVRTCDTCLVVVYRTTNNDLTILHATTRSSDLRRAACTVAKPPLPRI
jgi:hypothetical protein